MNIEKFDFVDSEDNACRLERLILKQMNKIVAMHQGFYAECVKYIYISNALYVIPT